MLETAEDYMRFDRERDEALKAKREKHKNPHRVEREKRLAAAKDEAYERTCTFGTAPVVDTRTGRVFYSKARCCKELLIKLQYLNRLLSYGDMRIATEDEARKCCEEEKAKPVDRGPVLNKHNKLLKKQALERRIKEAGEKRRKAHFATISKALIRKSDGKFFESVTEAAAERKCSHYMINKAIKAGDFTVLAHDQAVAYRKQLEKENDR